MGTKIKSAAIAQAGLFSRGSVDLQAKAAGACLKQVGVDPKQVGLLINTGVYRDRHTVEPAMSSFIQQKIGANGDGGGTGTFSFDLTNGGCGMLTGIMVADGFLCSGLTAHGLVVAGDAEPVQGLSVGYDFVPVAAAVLLTPGEENEGFVAFKTETETAYLDSFHGRMEWTGEKKKQNWLILRSGPSFAEECAVCGVCALERFLPEIGLSLGEIDLLLTSQSPAGVAAAIGGRTGLSDKIVDLAGTYGHIHTAGVGMALQSAMADGRFGRARNILFLTVGAGITTSLAFYRNI